MVRESRPTLSNGLLFSCIYSDLSFNVLGTSSYFKAVVGDLTELPHHLLASLPSLHVRHFHLAQDVSMPQGVGRGGEGDLGGDYSKMGNDKEQTKQYSYLLIGFQF